jgi:hypothetical protein
MAQSESCAIALDFGGPNGGAPDGLFDLVIGYPSSVAATSDPYPATCQNLDTSCFGVYLYAGTGTQDPENRFMYSNSSAVTPHAAVDHNPLTSQTQPDLEWSMLSFAALRKAAGFAPLGSGAWSFNMRVFAGSFQVRCARACACCDVESTG